MYIWLFPFGMIISTIVFGVVELLLLPKIDPSATRDFGLRKNDQQGHLTNRNPSQTSDSMPAH